jgi:hypothetical protein
VRNLETIGKRNGREYKNMNFIYVLAIILMAAVIIGEFFQQKTGVSAMPTIPAVRRRMLALISPPSGGKIVELGSGWGGMAIAAARQYPLCRVTGVESSIFPFIVSQIRRLMHPALKNIDFIRADFFDFSLRDTTAVLCYLCNPLMARLEKKFTAELPSGAVVVSSTFFIPGWTPEKNENVKGLWNTQIFVYRRP